MSRSCPEPISASAEHVRLVDVQLLSDNWYVLRKFTFDLRRRDGSWQLQSREAYDRGNGAALLLFDPQRRTVFEACMSPGSVTEKLHFFVADYQAEDRIKAGGGLAEEGEDIEVIEMPLAQALAGIGTGLIQDGKTVTLLQYVALSQIAGTTRDGKSA